MHQPLGLTAGGHSLAFSRPAHEFAADWAAWKSYCNAAAASGGPLRWKAHCSGV